MKGQEPRKGEKNSWESEREAAAPLRQNEDG